MTSTTTTEKPPKQPFYYEFGGPVGTLVTLVSLPFVILILIHWAEEGRVDIDWAAIREFTQGRLFWETVQASSVLCPSCKDTSFLLLRCGLSLVAWFLFQVLLERFLPGEVVSGTVVKNDPQHRRLTYRINGHLAFWVTFLIAHVGWPYWHESSQTIQFTSFPFHLLYTYFAELAFCTIIISIVLSIYLYLGSFVGNKVLAEGGNSGNVVYDFFMGRELNPRIGTFDWKVFCELRPGMMGWMLLNISCLQQQYQTLGYVTGSMLLVNMFQAMYVWDTLFQEQAILTTMDITSDGFGFMLVFGDLAWVPFTYSLQARYLVKYDPHLSAAALAAIVALHMLGFFIFRGANGQKDAFRRNPNDPKLAHMKFLQTKRGTKLLTSGWWGMARKINYTGDYIMGLTWCLLCGFSSIVPYYYAVYFAILLIHRSARDDHICRIKYGDDWEAYKKIVPYRFIPGLV